MDTSKQSQQPAAKQTASAQQKAPTTVAAPAVPPRQTERVRVKAGATIAVSETATGLDGKAVVKVVRKVGGDWIDMDVRDMKNPRLRAMVETEEDIETAAKPAKERAAKQAETQAMFARFVESDVRAAEREKAVRKPLLDAMTPQGTAPGPVSVG